MGAKRPKNLVTNIFEPWEDDFKIVIISDRIELTDKQNVLWWSNISVRKVSNHLQYGSSSVSFLEY